MQALVVVAHPCDDSFTHAAAERAVAGLRAGGHAVEVVDLYALGFRVAMSPAERQAYHGDTPLIDEQTREHARLVQWADCLVFVYPTWWSGLPAMLKGWLERVMVPGVAFVFDEGNGKVRPGLRTVRRLVGISTYGSPRWTVKMINDNGRRTITRALAHGVRTPDAHDVARPVRHRHGRRVAPAAVPRPGRDDDGATRVNVLVVYCHPDAGLVRRIRPRSGGRGRSTRPGQSRPRDRPVRRRVRSVLRRQRPAHPPRPGRRAIAAALRRRSALVRDVGARLPHLVERAAGDAEGLDRPGVGERCGVVASRPASNRMRPLLRNVRRIVVVTTHGSSKLVNSLQGEGGKRVVTRALRSLCNRRCRTTWVAMYGVDTSTARSNARLPRSGRTPAGEAVDARVVRGARQPPARATAISAATAALCSARARLAGTLRPSVASAMRPSTNGVTAAPTMPARSHSSWAQRQHGVELVGIELVGLRDRDTDEDARRRPRALAQRRHDLGRRVDAMRHAQPRRARVERGEPVVPPPEHRHTDRLEVLERARQVEERLRPGAHGDDRVVGQRVEIGADVAGQLGAAVHATDPSGREHLDARRRSQRDRGRDSRRTERPPLRHGDREVAFRGLARRTEDRGRAPISSSPTRATPSRTAVSAGTAPRSRMAPVHRSSASALAGDGKPRLEKIVDSRATTATPSDSAVATSSDTSGSSTSSVCQCVAGAVAIAVRDEPGDRLDVMRHREQVEHLGPLVAVAVLSKQRGVTGE